MPYCFYCHKEVDDLHRCPECGKKLLPDVNFMDHEESEEERLRREIRRRKLEEAYKHATNPKMYSDMDYEIEDDVQERIPFNFTSVRDNPKYREKKKHPEWETKEPEKHPFLKAFRYVLLFFSIIYIFMILDFYGYALEFQGFELNFLPDITSNITLVFFVLIFIFMILLPLIIITVAAGSSYDVRKRR